MSENSESATSGSSPLAGLRVVEFAQFIAGPSAGLALADLGASVTKIERLEGDNARVMGNYQAVYRAWNGGKRSLALDLSSPKGKQIAAKLIEDCDVAIESFRPGVMSRLGLGYEEARVANPGIIYASVSGFGYGQDGSARPATDAIIQAESGIMHATGEPGGGPLKVGFQVVDTASGLALTQAILAALVARARTGVGGWVRLSLFDVALYLQAHQFTEFGITGREPERTGNRSWATYPTDLFSARDGHLMISAYLQPHFVAMCEVLGLPELPNQAPFRDVPSRNAHRDELFPLLQEAFMGDTVESWVALFLERGLMAARVRSYDSIYEETMRSPESAFVNIRELPAGPEYPVVALPYRCDSWSRKLREVAPLLGEDAAEVLDEIGYDSAQVAQLKAEGVIG